MGSGSAGSVGAGSGYIWSFLGLVMVPVLGLVLFCCGDYGSVGAGSFENTLTQLTH